MHVVTSISLQTPPPSSRLAFSPGAGPECPEIALTSSVPVAMPLSSGLLNLHQKSFEFRCERIGVDCGGREKIGKSPRRFALVFRDATVAPMNGDADLVSLLAVDHHRLDPPGDERFGNVLAPGARNFDLFTAANPNLVCKLGGDFDERFGHKLHVHRIILRPVVIMLR